MKKREQSEYSRKKSNIKEETIKLTLDNEVAILLQYLKEMPITIRAQFMPGIRKLAEDPRINQLIR